MNYNKDNKFDRDIIFDVWMLEKYGTKNINKIIAFANKRRISKIQESIKIEDKPHYKKSAVLQSETLGFNRDTIYQSDTLFQTDGYLNIVAINGRDKQDRFDNGMRYFSINEKKIQEEKRKFIEEQKKTADKKILKVLQNGYLRYNPAIAVAVGGDTIAAVVYSMIESLQQKVSVVTVGLLSLRSRIGERAIIRALKILKDNNMITLDLCISSSKKRYKNYDFTTFFYVAKITNFVSVLLKESIDFLYDISIHNFKYYRKKYLEFMSACNFLKNNDIMLQRGK